MSFSTNYGATSSTPSETFTGGGGASSSVRFSQTCDVVGTNIFTINAGAASLDRILKQIGTSRDKPELRDHIHTTQQKTNGVIISTTSLIRELNFYAKGGDKQVRLRFERLKNEFGDAVQNYSNLQKQMAEKIRMTYGFQRTMSAALERSGEDDEGVGLLEEEAKRTFKQQQVVKELEFDQTLMEEREQRIQQLEEDILNVNEIFRELGAMVHVQGETINTIEANIDRAFHNVEGGASQLRTAADYQKKYRTKLCCFALIIISVAIVLIVVLVVSLK